MARTSFTYMILLCVVQLCVIAAGITTAVDALAGSNHNVVQAAFIFIVSSIVCAGSYGEYSHLLLWNWQLTHLLFQFCAAMEHTHG